MAQSLGVNGHTVPGAGPRAVRYFVAMGNDGGWLIFREGNRHPVQRVAQRIRAIETAKCMARDQAPSEVLVEREDGTFFLRYNFGGEHAVL